MATDYSEVIKALRENTKALRESLTSSRAASAKQETTTARPGSPQAARQEMASSGSKSQDAMAHLEKKGGKAQVDATGMEKLGKAAAKAGEVMASAARKAGVAMAGMAKTIGSALGSIQAKVAGLVSVGGIVGLGYVSVKAASQVEQLQLSFSGAGLSADAAASNVARLHEITTRLPVSVSALAQVQQGFMGIGFSAEIALQKVQAASLIAAGAFGPLEAETKAVADAMARLSIEARASLADVQAIANRGIPIFKQLEAYLAKSGRQVRGSVKGMLERGEISGFDVTQAMQQGASGNIGALEAKANSIAGIWQRIGAAGQQLFAKIGEKIATYFDLKGTESKILGFIQNLTSGVGVLDGIMARVGAVFQALRDTALTALNSLGATFGTTGGSLKELQKIGDDWYNGTLDAIEYLTVGFVKFGAEVAKVFGAIISAAGTAAGAITNVGDKLNYVNPAEDRSVFTDLYDIGSFALTGSMPVRGKGALTPEQRRKFEGGGSPGDSLKEIGKGLQSTDPSKVISDIQGSFRNMRRGGGNQGAPGGSEGERSKWLGPVQDIWKGMADREAAEAKARMQMEEKRLALETAARKYEGGGFSALDNAMSRIGELGRILQQQQELGGKGPISDRMVINEQAAAFKDLLGSLGGMTEIRNAGAISGYSREAYSADTRFRQEGRIDPTERLIKAQQAQLEQAKIQSDLMRQLVAKLGGGQQTVSIPGAPRSR